MSERVDRWSTFLETFPRERLGSRLGSGLGAVLGSHEAPSAGVPDDVPPRLGEGSARIEAVRPLRGVTVLRRASGPRGASIAFSAPSAAALDPRRGDAGAHAAIATAAAQLDGVTCVSRAASLDLYVISLDEGRPLAVRIGADLLEPELFARTVGHPAHEELVAIVDPADPSATYQIAVRGLYVIQISPAIDPVGVERALRDELAELVAHHRFRRPSRSSMANEAAAPLRSAPINDPISAPTSAPINAPLSASIAPLSSRPAVPGPAERRAPRCANPGCTICDRRGSARPARR